MAATTSYGAEQTDVIAFLSTPGAYPAHRTPVARVERIDTHISVVFLAGDRVFKLKRAVRFDYVDFSTIDRRRAACEAEIRLNRRTAPSLYLGVVSVTREPDGSLAIGGHGEPIDWLVEMVRFDQDTLFDRLAEHHALDLALMPGLADAVAALHAQAEMRRDMGGQDAMAWVIEGNALGLADQGDGGLDPAACEELTALARQALGRHAERLDRRRREGLVRWCHGDLHLGNICLVLNVPTIFDAIEFNERLSCIDVLYDVAFLVMDLWHRGLPAHANAVLNEYLVRTADLDALPLLPLFLSCRAAVRTKTQLAAARTQPDAAHARALRSAAREYLALAVECLQPVRPMLVAIGGFSGSGKSTLARHLAPGLGAPPGAVVLRSDVIRKHLSEVPALTRLGPEGYTPEMTRRVYDELVAQAGTAIAAGAAVVADAVFADRAEREAIAGVARRAGVPFLGLWLDGRPEVLERRLRERAGDASDATIDVLERQRRAGAGDIDWHRIDGSLDAASVARQAAERVRTVSPANR